MIHSNCQSAMNKRSEINSLIDAQNPHILALTEFGASKEVRDGDVGIKVFALYRGNHSDGCGGLGKGAALYVKDSLNHSPCPAMEDVAFDCSAWSIIKLARNRTLLVGVVYRSPNSMDENNLNLLNLLRAAAATHCDFLTICGDFNLPLIDWSVGRSLESENALSFKFVEVIEDLSLYQHAHSPTRFRGSQKSCLDLILTKEDNMVRSS